MKHLLMILLLPICLAGQVSRIFEFEVDGTDQVQRLSALIQAPGLKVTADPVLGLVSIYADSAEKAATAEQMFKKYFKPKAPIAERNIELVMHVLLAKSSGPGGDVPAVLAPVVQQLKQSTTLKFFEEVEMQMTRIRAGQQLQAVGSLKWDRLPMEIGPTYQMKADAGISGNLVKVNHLLFEARIPYDVGDGRTNTREVRIQSSFDLKPGQSFVVGKSNASPKDGALILVLSAKLVD